MNSFVDHAVPFGGVMTCGNVLDTGREAVEAHYWLTTVDLTAGMALHSLDAPSGSGPVRRSAE